MYQVDIGTFHACLCMQLCCIDMRWSRMSSPAPSSGSQRHIMDTLIEFWLEVGIQMGLVAKRIVNHEYLSFAGAER
jgi:hypothetical protein